MHFPPSIERLPKGERASARLRYYVQHAMLQAWNEINVKRLSNLSGYDHSSTAAAFKRGYFTPEMAQAFEKTLGRKHLQHEHLIDPLSIPTNKAAA